MAAGGQVMKPRGIRAGDRVGVVAPAGVVDAARLEAGLAVLRQWGLEPVVGRAVFERRRYLAGDDAARVGDLNAMLADPAVRAVFCARGGFGCQRMLPALDLAALGANPKLVIGYSDVTALLAAVVGSGGVGIHGPMVAADLARGLAARSRDALWALVSDPTFRASVEVPLVLSPGRARGRLVGGCLSVLAAAIGTPWALDTRGAILLLEDVNEPPYRVDRLLVQLRQAGMLDHVAAVVFGGMESCRSADGVDALDVIEDAFADAAYPVGFGMPVGHTAAETDVENVALPLGTEVELDLEAGRLVALEAAVV